MNPRYTVFAIAILIIINLCEMFADDSWTRLDGPYGGQVNCFAFKNNQYMFAGSNVEGIYRSSNNGDNWEPCSSGLDGLNITALAIAPDGKIYASVSGQGLYSSDDNGNSWVKKYSYPGSVIKAMVITKKGDIFIKTATYGLKRSHDCGNTWDSLGVDSGNLTISAIAESRDGRLFASVVNGKYIYMSSDNGDSWIKSDSMNVKGRNISSFAFTSGGYIFAGSSNKVIKSKDNGMTWDTLYSNLYNNTSNALMVIQDTILLLGTSQPAYYITENTEEWRSINFSVNTMTNVQCWALDSAGNIYAGNTSLGIFRTTINDNWGSGLWVEKSKGYSYLSLVTLQPYHDQIFTGSQNRIVFQYINNEWQSILNLESASCIAVSPRDDIFIGTVKNGISRITEGGTKLEEYPASFNYAISQFLFDGDTIFASKWHNENVGTIAFSHNYGVNWFQCDSGMRLSGADYTKNGRAVCGIAFDGAKNLVAQVVDSGFYRSTDRGMYWQKFGKFPVGWGPNAFLLFDSTYVVATAAHGIQVSTDDANTWTQTLNAQNVIAIERNKYGQIFAATSNSGIYFSNDNAQTFSKLPDFPFTITVSDIRVDEKNYILVSTSRGIFKYSQPTLVEGQSSQAVLKNISFRNHSNYVELLNNSFSENISCEVYDLFGRLVSKSEGLTGVAPIMDISGLNSGVYLLVAKISGRISGSETINIVK